MAGKLFLQICYFSCLVLFAVVQKIRTTPIFSLPSTPSERRGVNSRVALTELDEPLDVVLEAVMEMGGSIMFLIPQKDFEKRDALGPDLGTGRSYTGQRTAKVMWGQLASSSPTGPGKRKRNSTDGGGASYYNGEFHPNNNGRTGEEEFPSFDYLHRMQ